jgi:folate-binding protein YgfZ
MSIYLRADRAVLKFSGDDAQKLLNDVVTGVIRAEDDYPATWWALLSAQGKIQAEGLSGWHDGAFWLDVHESVADAFLKRMKMYRLRANVVIDDLRATHRVGFTQDREPSGIVHTDRMGAIDMGYRVIAELADTAEWVADDSEYARTRIGAGIAELGQDYAPDTTFAHDVGMDILDGIDFEKGCYIGQEVVSRMKHRGTARRRPVIVSGVSAPSGSPVLSGTRDSGTLGRVVDGHAVAIVRLDRFADRAEANVGGRPIQLQLPVWATYAFGEMAEEA